MTGGRRAAAASAGAVVTVLALVSLATATANVQGAAAPLASLLPMLTDGPVDGELAAVLEQARRRLAESVSSGAPAPPALDVLVDDFARYHAAMAVIATVVAVALAGAGIGLWRTAATGRGRRVLRSFAALSGLVAGLVAVVAVANTGTAADPAPALLAFFDGGW